MKLLIAMAAGALGYCYYAGKCARNARPQVKEDLHRWEDEGGNVPAVATPSPAPIPTSATPQVDPGLRH